MSEDRKGSNWVDFKEIREMTDTAYVLKVLQREEILVGLQQKGNEFVGWCPLGTKGHGKKDSFSLNAPKQTFQCFACKQRGSLFDLVKKLERLPTAREGARRVQEIMSTKQGDDAYEPQPHQSAIATPEAEKVPQNTSETLTSVEQLLQVTMTLRDAVQRVREGDLDPVAVVVVDVKMLNRLSGVVLSS